MNGQVPALSVPACHAPYRLESAAAKSRNYVQRPAAPIAVGLASSDCPTNRWIDKAVQGDEDRPVADQIPVPFGGRLTRPPSLSNPNASTWMTIAYFFALFNPASVPDCSVYQ